MPQINQLPLLEEVSPGDSLPVYSPDNGTAFKMPVSLLTEYLQGQLVGPSFTAITAAPSSSGFTVSFEDETQNQWLILQPVAGYAAGTIVLPAVASCQDGQELLVNCTQSVTTLTMNGNGATVTGAPSTLAANAFFRLRFYALTSTWFRVG